jgi:predicted CXXCH cytochrome family protein
MHRNTMTAGVCRRHHDLLQGGSDMSRRSLSALVCIAVLGLGVLGVLSYGCRNMPQTVSFLPPKIPGATFVGTSTCIVCHPEEGKTFRTADHGAFNLTEREGQTPNGEGCETCHGPGSLHVKNYPDKSTIMMPTWKDCVQCHLDKKAQFSLLYHHPVPEGLMDCTACHDPHSGLRPVFRVERINDTCLGCHPEVRGPYVFPHQAVTEDGCIACHNPHGTSFPKMLVADPSNLCLRCHFQSDFPLIGDEDHSSRIGRGCINCHRGIHGSNFDELLLHQ